MHLCKHNFVVYLGGGRGGRGGAGAVQDRCRGGAGAVQYRCQSTGGRLASAPRPRIPAGRPGGDRGGPAADQRPGGWLTAGWVAGRAGAGLTAHYMLLGWRVLVLPCALLVCSSITATRKASCLRVATCTVYMQLCVASYVPGPGRRPYP